MEITLKTLLNQLVTLEGSERRLAVRLGVSNTAVSKWRAGLTAPRDEHCRKIADMLGLRSDYVEALARAEAERHPEIRDAWRRIADRCKDAAVVAAMVIGAASFGLPSPAEAAPQLCIMSNGPRRKNLGVSQ